MPIRGRELPGFRILERRIELVERVALGGMEERVALGESGHEAGEVAGECLKESLQIG